VVEQYKKLTGCVTPGDSHDLGLVLSDVLKVWQQEGLFAGNKLAAYAPVDHTSVLDIHQAVAAYGVSYSGVALPESAEEQFNAGEPWTVVGDQPVGGHCVVIVGYDPAWLYVCTWGAIVKVSWAWWATYATECWALIPEEFVAAGHGPELDIPGMQADIGQLAVPPHLSWWDRILA